MVFPGISWFSWNQLEYSVISCCFLLISYNVPELESAGVSLNQLVFLESARIFWNQLEYSGISWNILESAEVP